VLLTGPFGGLTDDVREFLDLPDAATSGNGPAARGHGCPARTGPPMDRAVAGWAVVGVVAPRW
jgi:hypothetical protein